MAKLFDIDNTGVRAATLSGAKERFDEVSKYVFGDDIDTHTHTPQNQIAGINALVWAEVGEEIQKIALWGASLDHAAGNFLDAFGSLLGIRRRHATHTRVECVLTGVDGITIPKDSIVKNKNGDEFLSEESVSIVNGKANVLFVAYKPGAISAEAGEINTIVSVTDPRWKTVNNPRSGLIGRDEESDTEYRNNLKNLTAIPSVSTISALNDSLKSAGSVKSLILENATDTQQTKKLISIPSRSLMVIADGGLESDLERAYSMRRPIGVGTFASKYSSKIWVPGNTSDVNSGAYKFNKNEIYGVDLTSVSTSSALTSKLNQDTHAPNFTAIDSLPIFSYEWTPEIEGMEQIHGNEEESVLSDGLEIDCIFVRSGGNYAYLSFNKKIDISSNISFTLTSTSSTDQTTTNHTSTLNRAEGNLLYYNINPAIPSNTESVVANVSAKMNGETETNYFNDSPVHLISDDFDNSPKFCGINLTSRSSGLKFTAFFAGKSSNDNPMYLQYIRYDGLDYLDKDANGNREWKTLSSNGNGWFLNRTVNGYTTNQKGALLYLRTYIEIDNIRYTSDTEIIPFVALPSTSGSLLQAENAIVDGKWIKIKFNNILEHSFSQSCNWWSVSGNTVVSQRVFDHYVYLQLSSVVSPGSNLTISYDRSSDSGETVKIINSSSRPSDFTIPSKLVKNIAKPGLPSMPAEFRGFQYDDYLRLLWDDNYNGGQSMTSQEYSVSYDDGDTWSDYTSISQSKRGLDILPSTTNQFPNRIKLRASNPNAQLIEKLGFTGADALYPITRPVEKALSVEINLNNASSLIRNALEDIKDALVNRVNEYDLGATIWTNDLLAICELIQGVQINTFTVKHNNASVNDVEQPAYIKWTLNKNDIIFS